MKKTVFSLSTLLLTSSLIANPGFAQTEETPVPSNAVEQTEETPVSSDVVEESEETPVSSDIVEQAEDLINESESVDLVNLDELPEGAPVVYFDTVEDFEKALKELEEEQKASAEEPIEAVEVPTAEVPAPEGISLAPINPKTSSIQTNYATTSATTAATTTKTVRYSVAWKYTWNPLLEQVRPPYITVNMKYTSSGSGSSKKFTKINSISSYSTLSFPVDWTQTSYSTSFYNTNKNVTVKMLGYHLLGVNIGGQGIGARVNDTLNYKYPISGDSFVIAYK